MSTIELRTQIRLLRSQLYTLEVKCQDREDKLMNLILILEPFINALSPEMHKQILDVLD
jgi:hypothetical protein